MNHDRVMRITLATGAVFNAFAAAMILMPDSLGRFAALPTDAPRVYVWMLAMFILLFGAVYAWLAQRPEIDRPFVLLGITGKTGVFLIAMICLVLGDLSGRAMIPAFGDLIFAALFAWWYIRSADHLKPSAALAGDAA